MSYCIICGQFIEPTLRITDSKLPIFENKPCHQSCYDELLERTDSKETAVYLNDPRDWFSVFNRHKGHKLSVRSIEAENDLFVNCFTCQKNLIKIWNNLEKPLIIENIPESGVNVAPPDEDT